ncbi:MAG TPA: RHS repeat-associated core domain-containing protein, partial [Cellvibrionaceae bacterium]|nr:RHS repeat-associated core domain-containing protein [Cellvibrionaceae bacterium]
GSSATIHGFTGHEHLDDGLIHMNGRVYDPVLGRFLSADPMIQAPDNLQSFNRYSYVLNNPLFYTDPSGYSWFSKLFRTVVSIAIMVYAPGLLQTYASLSPVAANLTAGFLSGAVGSGSLQGGVMGVLSAGMFMGIGSSIPDWGLMKVAAHGIAGGMMSVMQGGDFGAGFLSGGFTQAFAPAIDGIDPSTYGPSMQRTIAAAVVGGTGSVIGGGKFANGAITGAFSRLFNDDNHARQFGHPLTLKRFEPIIQAANINLAANMEKASKMSFIEWVDAVRTGGDWDYKNNKNVIDAGISPSLRDEFGNFHFGMTAAARGYSLGFTLTGAGSYQTFFQGSKSAGGWNPFAAAYPNAVADIMSTHGFRFGDNPGDSMAIRNGWRYYNGE